jgi:hypothetical protein
MACHPNDVSPIWPVTCSVVEGEGLLIETCTYKIILTVVSKAMAYLVCSAVAKASDKCHLYLSLVTHLSPIACQLSPEA